VSEELRVRIEELKVLADETRMRILMLLASKGEMKLSDISRLIGKSKSTVFEHLKVLVGAGLVDRKEIDRAHYYFLTDKGKSAITSISAGDYSSLRHEVLVEKEKLEISKVQVAVSIAIELFRMKGHYLIPLIAGLSMAFLGYVQLSSILASLAVGAFLGFLRVDARKFIKGALVYAVATAISAIIKEGALPMVLVLPIALGIFILVGGLAYITVKLFIGESKW